jgi:FKBP-type peptidyl-prolyl cis-trans isomerase FkpA
MKNFSFALVTLLVISLMSCSEKETPGGIKYTVLKKGDGVEPPTGQFMVMDLNLKDSTDSVWYNTKDLGYPAILPVPDASMIKDEGEFGVFKVMTKGDCITFKLPAATIFTKTRNLPVPKEVNPKSEFTYIASLRDVMDQGQVEAFQMKITQEMQRKQMTTDSTLIAEYLKTNSLEALSTPSGIRYIVQKEGKGDKPVPRKKVFVQYAGYTLDGKLFDTSISSVAKANNLNNGATDNPYPVVIGAGGVIQGWGEILQLMNKGMKVKVFIPSALGYGPRGKGSIPPNAVLVFDMEVTEIK